MALRKVSSASGGPKKAVCSRGGGAPSSWSGSRPGSSAAMGSRRRGRYHVCGRDRSRRCRSGRKLFAEPPLDRLPDQLLDRVRLARGVDHDATLRFGKCDVDESLAKQLMKVAILRFEAVRALCPQPAAYFGARQADLWRE